MQRSARGGFVLLLVLFFALLLVSSITAFLHRATLDAAIARNRDDAERAEALARGGVQLAVALLLQDRVEEAEVDFEAETRRDTWAVGDPLVVSTEDGGLLQLAIEDSGSRLNLNSLFAEGRAIDGAEAFLDAFLEKVIEEMPGRPEEKLYDPDELARNLIDFIDEDDIGLRGGDEDEYYRAQRPPYRAANRPLLSVDELGLVEGFDQDLVEALRPYLTVYPYGGGGGINPNTAPSYVLAALFHGPPGDQRLATRDVVADVLKLRERGGILCSSSEGDACTWIEDLVPGQIFPEPNWLTDTFHVVSEARYAELTRRIEAVIDRGEVLEPRILAWRVH